MEAGMERATIFARAQRIQLVILDVDGVLTDGGIYIGATGELYKPFHVRDGLGIRLWEKAGGRTAIITGRTSEIVAYRAQELGISEIHMGMLDKRAAYGALKAKYALGDAEIAYIGDDLIDLPIMMRVGLPIAVGDAVDEIKSVAAVVTKAVGGRGAVREAMECILRAQDKWNKIVEDFRCPAEGMTGLGQ